MSPPCRRSGVLLSTPRSPRSSNSPTSGRLGGEKMRTRSPFPRRAPHSGVRPAEDGTRPGVPLPRDRTAAGRDPPGRRARRRRRQGSAVRAGEALDHRVRLSGVRNPRHLEMVELTRKSLEDLRCAIGRHRGPRRIFDHQETRDIQQRPTDEAILVSNEGDANDLHLALSVPRSSARHGANDALPLTRETTTRRVALGRILHVEGHGVNAARVVMNRGRAERARWRPAR